MWMAIFQDHPDIPPDRCSNKDWAGASLHISERWPASADTTARCCCGCWSGCPSARNAGRNSPEFAAGDGEVSNCNRSRGRD